MASSRLSLATSLLLRCNAAAAIIGSLGLKWEKSACSTEIDAVSDIMGSTVIVQASNEF